MTPVETKTEVESPAESAPVTKPKAKRRGGKKKKAMKTCDVTAQILAGDSTAGGEAETKTETVEELEQFPIFQLI